MGDLNCSGVITDQYLDLPLVFHRMLTLFQKALFLPCKVRSLLKLRGPERVLNTLNDVDMGSIFLKILVRS